MRKLFFCAAAWLFALTAFAQGGNTGDGGPDGDYASLAERVLSLEKKTDNFNLYFNYAAAYRADFAPGDFASSFYAKNLRLEIKGSFGEHLSYRLRHRLNSPQAGLGLDHFARATDLMFLTWKFNDKFSLMGGKICQYWGGYEYDENPMFIYEYSDMLNMVDIFLTGAILTWRPVPNHEFALTVSNAYSGSFSEEYGAAPVTFGGKTVEEARSPLSYIFNWNGSLFGGTLETRWSAGFYNQAKGYTDSMLYLGQKLSLPRFQLYFDYMEAWESIDRLRIATAELGGGSIMTGVHYRSLVSKANWQFAPKWNLMLKGMFETASCDGFKDYRRALGAVSAIEYYPLEDQDLRFSLSFIGRDFGYTGVDLPDTRTARVELGFMYRIKAY